MPGHWQRDEAFSQVIYLTPAELTELGGAIREMIAAYLPREREPTQRPEGAEAAAIVVRLFPLMAPDDP